MSVTMILSALLLLALVVIIALVIAYGRQHHAALVANEALDAYESKIRALALPALLIVPSDDPEFEGYVEVDVGDHSDALRVVVRYTDGGESVYGKRILKCLQFFATCTHWKESRDA
ncbi:MAG TPA: hypothetical protein VGD46_13440 [Rhizobacter sp.]